MPKLGLWLDHPPTDLPALARLTPWLGFGPATLADVPAARAARPHLTALGAFTSPPPNESLAPALAATQWLETHRAQLAAYPAMTAWLGPDQPALADLTATTLRRLTWWADFEAARARLLADLGTTSLCAPRLPTAAPDWGAFVGAFLPALDALDQHGGALLLPADPANPFAYRTLYTHVLTANGLDNLPLWLRLANLPADLAALDAELAHDRYVRAALLRAEAAPGLQAALEPARYAHLLPPEAEAVSFSVAVPAPAEGRIPRAGDLPPKAPPTHGLVNAGFESGWVTYADTTYEHAVPHGWEMETLPGYVWPLTVLINSHNVAKAERARIFAEGAYVWKVCGAAEPAGLALQQTLTGLSAGHTYTFSVNILADGPDAEAVQVTLRVGNEAHTQASPPGAYHRHTLTFTADGDTETVRVELALTTPLPFGAVYVDELVVSSA